MSWLNNTNRSGHGSARPSVLPCASASPVYALNQLSSRQLSRAMAGSKLLVLLAMATSFASALHAATSSTVIAVGITSPSNGVILANAAGKRYLWYGDGGGGGLCRLDPDLDSGAVSFSAATCIAMKPGQLTYDPVNRFLYTVDLATKTQGIIRLHYLPDGGVDHKGSFDGQIVLGAAGGGCGIPGNVPNSAVLGPDGSLYVGFKRSGNLVRVVAPETNPPCGNYQTFGKTSDGRKDFGLGFIGNDLYGADGNGPWVIPNATACVSCTGSVTFVPPITAPTIMASDQAYQGRGSTPAGSTLLYGDATSVSSVKFAGGFPTVTTGVATGFAFVSGIVFDPAHPGINLYVGDDQSNGVSIGTGRWWKVTNSPDGPPTQQETNVTAAAGHLGATVSWTAVPDTQPVTAYIVRTYVDSQIPTTSFDTIVTSSPAAISGLAAGSTYHFTILAMNTAGIGPESLPSAPVVPLPLADPVAPSSVTAAVSFGNAATDTVVVNWTPPVDNGGQLITTYQVSALSNATVVTSMAVAPPATSAAITLPADGSVTTFAVQASNNGGTSFGASAASRSLALVPITHLGISSFFSSVGPGPVNPGTTVTFSTTILNQGPADSRQAIFTQSIPADATFQSATLNGSPLVCSPVSGLITCQLGPLANGASDIVVTQIQLASTTSTTASITNADGLGNSLPDFIVFNQFPTTSSVSVGVNTPPPPVSADLQLNGSANKSGVVAGTVITYTWQIKNSSGSAVSGVTFDNTFNVPAAGSITIQSATMGGVACLPAAPLTITSSATHLTCALDPNTKLSVGQALQVQINATMSAAGTYVSFGQVSFTGTDTQPGNNSNSVTVTIK